MTEILGDFGESSNGSQEYLILGFSPSSIPLKQRWRNNGLSADFMADYLTTFFPSPEDPVRSVERQREIRSIAGYICNELLENAMKFNDESSAHPVSIKLQLFKNKIIFLVSNSLPEEKVERFKEYIKLLLNSNTYKLYIQKLEDNSDANTNSSGLGLLTMINDYQAKLGWSFEKLTEPVPTFLVTTRVEIQVD